jgi:predicted nucleotidyltransferase component of viral defense system
VSKNEIQNIAHSIHRRLLNKAKEMNRPFNELLQYYAMERFLCRLSKSDYAGKYILKGALMLRVWQAPFARPTMDIDMLGKTSNDIDAVVRQFKDICDVTVEPDGLTFNPDSIRAQRITEDADYEGLRLRFTGNLGNARISIQIDIGFGDVVFPKPKSEALPTILDFAPPKLSCYSRESMVAEKFEAMVRHSDLNSRMKDFYDIWLITGQFDFDGSVLLKAVSKTFQNRNVEVPGKIPAFTKDFAASKQKQWDVFYRRLSTKDIPHDFHEVIRFISEFLQPIADAIVSEHNFNMHWNASKRQWQK